MKEELAELEDLLAKKEEECEAEIPYEKQAKAEIPQVTAAPEGEAPRGKSTQYATSDDQQYFLCAKTVKKLPPGLYTFYVSPERGPFFQRQVFNNEALIRFPDTNIDRVVTEIERFWELEKHFSSHNLTFKRGIILWGPPGSGKSCAIRLVSEAVVKRDGIVVSEFNPNTFLPCYRAIRNIEPETPIVCLMEDLDATLEIFNETQVLNILDGIHSLHKIVFLATTNYPEKLGKRIINRPCRFDRKFKIDFPSAAARRIYFQFIWKDIPSATLEMWVEDTEEMTFAHLRELFVAQHLFNSNYEETLEILKGMKELVSSEDDNGKVGFGKARKKREANIGYSGGEGKTGPTG